MLDISYLPLRPGTHPEVNSMTFEHPPLLKQHQVVPRLRGALLESSKLYKSGEGKRYPDKEAAVSRLLQPPGYMRGRPVEAILEREAAEHLVARGTRPLEGGALLFSRDRRFTLSFVQLSNVSQAYQPFEGQRYKRYIYESCKGGPTHCSTH